MSIHWPATIEDPSQTKSRNANLWTHRGVTLVGSAKCLCSGGQQGRLEALSPCLVEPHGNDTIVTSSRSIVKNLEVL
jgi:hypothetical protein